MTSTRCARRLGWVLLVLLGLACKGDTGEPGAEGPPGPQGPPGESSDPDQIDPEPDGLVGRVLESDSNAVPGGTVYLVPATDVEALAAMPIDPFLSPEETAMLEIDEPIEDSIEVNGASYERATVDESGVYRFVTLPEGAHFVAWVPADGDDTHFPGGDWSSTALDTTSLIGMQLDLRVSGRPGPTASYVGSTTCLGCHGFVGTARTAHAVGLQVPGVRSLLQDVDPWPEFDAGLDAFDAGVTLYFYDCSASASTHADPSVCKVQIEDPGSGVRFLARLRRDPDKPLGTLGAYFVELENAVTSEPVETLDVVLTYGGAVGKQQYLTRRTNADGSLSYFVLPIIYNYDGSFDYGNLPGGGGSNDWPWRDYRSDLWFDFTSDTLRDPATSPTSDESFDNNCAGCHFTGYELAGNGDSGWTASAVVDPQGAFDYDGDGRPELINVGCESCHGPGSDHLTPSPNGRFIVSPGALTPGRRAMLCGSCHSRPLGIGGAERGLPLSTDDRMPLPGIRRSDFALEHTTRVGGAPSDFYQSGDERSQYQEYSGHLLTGHYRNGERMVSCSNCHNPHDNDGEARGVEPENPNSLCTTCHSDLTDPVDLDAHVSNATGNTTHDGFGLLCVDCHAVGTARSGAAIPELFDPGSGMGSDVQYFWNDVSSHRLEMTRWRDVGEPLTQPVAFTIACGSCHANFLLNPPSP